MKAIVYHEYGPPEVLSVAEVEKPQPKDNELLIRVRAAEATKSDCEMRSFDFAVKWFLLPLRLTIGFFRPKRPILGGYFAGEVVGAGKAVTKFKTGDEIFGSCGLLFGAYGEYMCLPEGNTLAVKPTNQSFEEAAAVPLGGLNAIHFMRRANIKRGEKVLINGAGASIGTFALQIAKDMGAEVTAVDSSIKQEMLHAIGADHVIDYDQENFTGNGKTYDVIFDMVAASSVSKCIASLNPKGRYLKGNPRVLDMLRSATTNWFSDKTASFVFAGETEEELLTLKVMIEDGKIKAVIDRIYPMEEVAAAHHRVETEQRCGIVVLRIGKPN